MKSGLVPEEILPRFSDLCGETIGMINPFFKEKDFIRIHGDCHRGNILDRLDEGLLIIDFDDMMTGPLGTGFMAAPSGTSVRVSGGDGPAPKRTSGGLLHLINFFFDWVLYNSLHALYTIFRICINKRQGLLLFFLLLFLLLLLLCFLGFLLFVLFGVSFFTHFFPPLAILTIIHQTEAVREVEISPLSACSGRYYPVSVRRPCLRHTNPSIFNPWQEKHYVPGGSSSGPTPHPSTSAPYLYPI